MVDRVNDRSHLSAPDDQRADAQEQGCPLQPGRADRLLRRVDVRCTASRGIAVSRAAASARSFLRMRVSAPTDSPYPGYASIDDDRTIPSWRALVSGSSQIRLPLHHSASLFRQAARPPAEGIRRRAAHERHGQARSTLRTPRTAHDHPRDSRSRAGLRACGAARA